MWMYTNYGEIINLDNVEAVFIDGVSTNLGGSYEIIASTISGKYFAIDGKFTEKDVALKSLTYIKNNILVKHSEIIE